MNKENIFTKEERLMLLEALKRLILERKPIYEGYQKYYLKEIKKKEETSKGLEQSKEGQ